MILSEWQKEKEQGGRTFLFSSLIGIVRSLLYRWKGRQEKGCLENFKPIAKNHPLKISQEKRQEVINLYQKKKKAKKPYDEKALGYLTNLSHGLVGKILRAYRGKIKGKKILADDFYQFDYLHLCWSADFMMLKVKEGWAKVLILLEEYSRHILGYKIVLRMTAQEVENLLLWAVNFYRIKPLLFKHDRGTQFTAKRIKSILAFLNIMDLATRTHYPYSNGKNERKIKEVRKWLSPFEGIAFQKLKEVAPERIDEINWFYPRIIFNGLTSGKVLLKGPLLEEKVKEKFRLMVKEKEEQLISLDKYFSKARWKAVQESLKEMNLISSGKKPVFTLEESLNKRSSSDFSKVGNIWIPREKEILPQKEVKEVATIEPKNGWEKVVREENLGVAEVGQNVYQFLPDFV